MFPEVVSLTTRLSTRVAANHRPCLHVRVLISLLRARPTILVPWRCEIMSKTGQAAITFGDARAKLGEGLKSVC
jgi:hypothetical protein